MSASLNMNASRADNSPRPEGLGAPWGLALRSRSFRDAGARESTMPITQDNAGLHLPLLYQWLQKTACGRWDGPEQQLCQAAIQKLQEYIRLNFAVARAPSSPTAAPWDGDLHGVPHQGAGGRGDRGPQFWEHPCVWGLWGKAQRGQEEKTHQGPVLDVGCIWVTERGRTARPGRAGKVRSSGRDPLAEWAADGRS